MKDSIHSGEEGISSDFELRGLTAHGRAASGPPRARTLLGIGALACLAALLQPASFADAADAAGAADVAGDANAAAPEQLEEIVVTAQKIAQDLQKTPLSITAITGARLDQLGASDNDSMAFSIPNVTFGTFKSDAQITIRGVGNDNLTIGGDPGVAYHEDGVYLSRGALANDEFFDVDRVEVLRGPQGTLYGRNAVGGVINVISTKPTDEFSGHADLLEGTDDRIRARAAVNIPIADEWATRFAVISDEHQGYVRNVYNGSDEENLNLKSGRAQLQWTGSDKQSVLFQVEEQTERDTGAVRRLLAPQNSPELGVVAPQPSSPYAVDHSANDSQQIDHAGANITASFNLGEYVAFKSISGYNRSKVLQFFDLDDTGSNYAYGGRTDYDVSVSQEFNFSGHIADSFDWIAGLYYIYDEVHGPVPITIAPYSLNLLYTGEQWLHAYAGYTQATYHVTSGIRVTAGVRYSKEDKDVIETEDDVTATTYLRRPYSASAVTPHFGVEYDLNDTSMAYATATRGFKSGGFNIDSFAPSYASEFIWAYEVGLKSTWLEQRIRSNVSAFHYDYSNLQVNVKEPGDTFFSIKNAGAAKVNGAELEVEAIPVRDMRVNLALGYLDATYLTLVSADATRPGQGPLPPNGAYDLAGNTLPLSPRFKGSLSTSYRLGVQDWGTFIPMVDIDYQARVYFLPFNVEPFVQGGYGKLNLSLGYEAPNPHWQANAFVRNVTNKATISNAFVGLVTSQPSDEAFYDPPRTYGVSVGYKW
jgi:iron complex outermembrane receptor protein